MKAKPLKEILSFSATHCVEAENVGYLYLDVQIQSLSLSMCVCVLCNQCVGSLIGWPFVGCEMSWLISAVL